MKKEDIGAFKRFTLHEFCAAEAGASRQRIKSLQISAILTKVSNPQSVRYAAQLSVERPTCLDVSSIAQTINFINLQVLCILFGMPLIISRVSDLVFLLF